MSEGWPSVRLGAVLRRSEDTIELEPHERYDQVTVRLWGKGVTLRGTVTGADVAARRQFVVRKGQFILSRIDARNGAFGLVPSQLDGAIVSNDFPVFTVDEGRLFLPFLGWLSQTAGFVDMCRRASEGTTNRVRLQEKRFLSLNIALPSLCEQQRIVGRIEDLAIEIRKARELRQRTIEETKALTASWLNSTFSNLSRTGTRALGEISNIVGGGLIPDLNGTSASAAEVLFVKVSDMNRPGNEIFIRSSANGVSRNSELLRGVRVLPPKSVIFPKTRLGQPDGISPSRMAEMLEVDKAEPKVRC